MDGALRDRAADLLLETAIHLPDEFVLSGQILIACVHP